jgi:hypothetical protein
MESTSPCPRRRKLPASERVSIPTKRLKASSVGTGAGSRGRRWPRHDEARRHPEACRIMASSAAPTGEPLAFATRPRAPRRARTPFAGRWGPGLRQEDEVLHQGVQACFQLFVARLGRNAVGADSSMRNESHDHRRLLATPNFPTMA